MSYTSLLSVLAVLALSSTASASALTLPPAVETPVTWSAVPKPVEIVRFQGLPQRFNDAIVKVTMTIDENGTPRDITGVRPLPSDLSSKLLPTLAKWKFSPAQDKEGRPIAMRVVLPLRLVNIL